MTKLTFAVAADLVQEERKDLLQVWGKDKSTELRGISKLRVGLGCCKGLVRSETV